MKRHINNWLAISVTLLIALAISTFSTAANAENAEFNSLCSGCHSKTPGPTPGAGYEPIVASNYTNSQLAAYIDANMPKGNASACDAGCAQRMADFLKPVIPPGPNAPPVAKIRPYPATVGKPPIDVTFYATDSTDDNGIVSYTWDFGDKSTGTGDSPKHTYKTAGTYTATLTVADIQGLTSTATAKIYVVTTHTPPVINTTKSKNLTGTSPLTPTFDASLSTCTGGCKSYSWNYDDLGYSNDAVTTHTFNTVGTHLVTLYVFDGGDISDPATKSTATLTVTVNMSSVTPTANATLSQNLKGAAPLTPQFDASLSYCANSCGSYSWNFGDNTPVVTVTDPKTTHAYQNAGNYTATLTVTDKSNNKKATTTVPIKVVPSESLTTYVQACQQQLGFTSIPDNIDCYSGDLFQTPEDFDQNGSVNDYMGYRKISDEVDMAFACRWLFGNPVDDRRSPISIEMLVHNRNNGNTCFFSAKGFVSGDPGLTSSVIRSPTSTAATTFWDTPASVDAKVRCIGCHVSGPYISTPTIAPFLAKHGLLNNGHDTLSNVGVGDLSTPNKNVKYHAVSGLANNQPGAFSLWDSLKQSYIDPSYIDPAKSGCAMGCHSVGTLSPQGDIGQIQLGFTTILHGPANQLKEISYANAMKPYEDWSDYRWINLGSPGSSATGVETESFANALGATTTLVPKLFDSNNPNCAQPNVPVVMEAHAVGSDNVMVITSPNRYTWIPDRLATFNVREGLVCLNSDQDAGQKCQDYSVQYECSDVFNKKTWTGFVSHALKADGDHEERPTNICPAGTTATGIQAQYTHPANGWIYSTYGPNDRLANFSQYGITCNNADQSDKQCSNYVVRYSSCVAPPATQSNKTLTNENTTAGSKQLTAASGSLAKGQAHNGGWNTQAWTIEPVTNTEYVRLKSTNTGVYLNVSSQAESTEVSTASLNTTWLSEMWLIEPVSGSSYVRLKNLWTGKYLTMADPNTVSASLKDYLPIYSQGRNTGWNTQRWLIQ